MRGSEVDGSRGFARRFIDSRSLASRKAKIGFVLLQLVQVVKAANKQ